MYFNIEIRMELSFGYIRNIYDIIESFFFLLYRDKLKFRRVNRLWTNSFRSTICGQVVYTKYSYVSTLLSCFWVIANDSRKWPQLGYRVASKFKIVEEWDSYCFEVFWKRKFSINRIVVGMRSRFSIRSDCAIKRSCYLSLGSTGHF